MHVIIFHVILSCLLLYLKLSEFSFLFSDFTVYVHNLYFSIPVRFFLGLLGLLAFSKFCKSIATKFGKDVGKIMVVLTVTQFHFLFYISRPLPNTFALILGWYTHVYMYLTTLFLRQSLYSEEIP